MGFAAGEDEKLPERRLAITIKGAISLGAYEAGAIAETLRLIAYNNSQTGATPWYIDAACGASAGSITSAMLAAALVRGDTDVLHRTWVTSVSLAALAPDDSRMSDNSILDATALDRLAQQNLTYPKLANRHPALRPPPSSLKLRFTLSRYWPEVLSQDTLNQAKLAFHQYKDSADFTVGITQASGSSVVPVSIATSGVAAAGYHNPDPALSGGDAWTALVQTAIASGSFPFAFAPRHLRRWVNDAWVDEYFSDGGAFDNDPIGQTINIAHDIDWAETEEAKQYADIDRRFLMIHVEPFDNSPPEVIPGNQPTLDVNPLALAQKYFPAIIEESENSGLLGIVGVNAKIAERSSVLGRLVDLVKGGAGGIPNEVLEALAKYRKLAKDSELPARLKFFRDHLIADLKQSDPAIFQRIQRDLPTAAQQQIFTDLALAYDLATNLADKTRLSPILISPAQRLSGSGIYAFGGFLVTQMRERDYAQGVYDAYQAWKAVANSQRDFSLDPGSPPTAPATAAELFPSCQNEYQKGIDRLIARVDRVIAALSEAATSSTIAGAAMRTVLDAIAKRLLNQAASGP